jgi:hypothetical protein
MKKLIALMLVVSVTGAVIAQQATPQPKTSPAPISNKTNAPMDPGKDKDKKHHRHHHRHHKSSEAKKI